MKISARNQLKGTIQSIEIGAVMATVIVKLDDSEQLVTSVITIGSVNELGLKVGDKVAAIIKSTEVMIGVTE